MKPKSKPLKITTQGSYFRRWENILVNSSGLSGIVTEKVTRRSETTITIYPYNPSDNKFIRMLQFIWLRIKVHYS